ncbi:MULTISPECIES: phage replisome organizer N-terminal domain-containing protein [Staphylococcus]|uniref:Phage replisome organizer N-terminal domain-containing protein n=1 Tax=Staphylococcus equorum TaxID=246432 RepID=A0A9X4R113_9STAP|nr:MULTISPECIES: phage replisome organizer N-terminal domain-containing protein [Staphylococcus]KRG09866.1 replication protein [Staphylococcus sp. NAM3COL9]MDG0843394.1 phage replisome organizer N-terminal domain-containing protein [Staphylococcus equorum]MDG0858705.1 phage replisome organizer N-terminal domain-containing protein [Staphylococcus equorum]
MGEVSWIKLKVGMFDDSKIKYIEALPERDTIITIWVKLLTLAGKYNEQGYIMLSENLPYNEEMLANEFNRPLNSIRLALQTFETLGMTEIVQGVIKISNWEKHQNIEGLDKIREQNRLRKQKQREKQKTLPDSHVKSRDGHATDIELELEEELELEKRNTLSSKSTMHPYQSVIEYLNNKTGKHYKPTTNKTQTVIKARCNEGFTEDDFKKVIDNKVAEWKGTDMEKFLRPETLFGNKFEGYLNQQVSNKESDDNPYANLF